jgi:DNA-binding beta-propeller fold protein YncE
VVQWDAPVVEQFSTDGGDLGAFDSGAVGCTDIEVTTDSQLLVADYGHSMVRVFTLDGAPVEAFGSFGAGPGEFNGAIGLAVGPDGSIYVADEGNARIQRFGGATTGIAPDAASADRLAIRSILPNPGRTAFEITYDLAREEQVDLTVVDLRGRVVATLVRGTAAGGTHRLQWTARSLPAGVYLARLAHDSRVETARLTIVK